MTEEEKLFKKKIKTINDFNQVVKKYFKYCFIFNDGVIVCEDKDKCTKKGFHFCTIEMVPLDIVPVDQVIKISCETIFKTIRDRKKEIQSIEEIDGDIYFVLDTERIHMGSIVTEGGLKQEIKDNYDMAKNLLSLSEDHDKSILTEETVVALVNNELIHYDKDNTNLRITKELVPNLKKDSNVSIEFFDVKKNLQLFQLFFSVIRENVNSYHRYICIRNNEED